MVLADEVLTPDSSRFWDAEGWRPGHALPSYDKQFVRDWLLQRVRLGPAVGEAPASAAGRHRGRDPDALPQAYERLTGRPLAAGDS